MLPADYPIPKALTRTETVVNKSRFITTVAPAADVVAARAFIASVREEFGDAGHNCYAFVAGAPGHTGQAGMSDDGEPAGTAGRPMLACLLHSGIGEVAVVVTRYFGGVKLGKGGLVRAYTAAVKGGLQALELTRRQFRAELEIVLEYADLPPVEQRLQAFEAEIVAAVYGEAVALNIALPMAAEADFIQAVRGSTGGRSKITRR